MKVLDLKDLAFVSGAGAPTPTEGTICPPGEDPSQPGNAPGTGAPSNEGTICPPGPGTAPGTAPGGDGMPGRD
ncbi:hypothetical protein swp_4896 [Shewanella piezotolerans WP3]|uniref:Uncharacterized protein n=1 Tax=Shewanella piezotolerans (strain WP3 / JCM 13877) TaxID=225849 RepID=B8CV41_SHEPW|nr:hypothetical protein [Shewanella piezotolerans]ACJ31517.1 hypothetical protein swp_4896 [Shewanella piezotolerans WP3]